MRINYKVIVGGLLFRTEDLKGKLKEKKVRILKTFGNFIKKETDETIEQLAHGGAWTYRGIRWDPFEPQYKRKDGTEVPAWGGTTKVGGKGKVKGQKRGERKGGNLLKPNDKLLQDRGNLKKMAASNMIIDPDGKNMRINSGALGKSGKRSEYFGRQQALRGYMTFTDIELSTFRNTVVKFYDLHTSSPDKSTFLYHYGRRRG
jgi:hypothetical protein